MITLEIHFLGVTEGHRKIWKEVFLKNGLTDLDEQNIVYAVDNNEAIPKKNVWK